MIQVLRKELNTFLNSLIAYIVISVFLTAIGLLMWVFPETSLLEYGYANMEPLFSFAPYIFIFLIPAITMRMFAEEKKTGTIELLLTKPLTDWKIIFGKYLSGVLLVAFSLIPTILYYWSVSQLGNPAGNIDTPGVIGSYIGLFLLGSVFTAIGIFASSVSTNQVIAFVIAVFLCFIMYSGWGSIAAIDVWGSLSSFFEQLGIIYHYNTMSKGLLDTRDLVYFLGMIGVMLLLTKLSLGSRRW